MQLTIKNIAFDHVYVTIKIMDMPKQIVMSIAPELTYNTDFNIRLPIITLLWDKFLSGQELMRIENLKVKTQLFKMV